MNKIQPVKFNSIDDFLSFLPEDELKIVNFLRDLILSCIPFCTEKLSYNVPYYYLNKRILFIWPSSVPWGKVDKGGVMIGFCKGYLLDDELGYLEGRDKKEIRSKTFYTNNEIDIDLLKTYIFSAVELDKKC